MDSLKKKSRYSSSSPRHTCSVDCNHQTENSRKECGTDGRDARSEVKPRKYSDDGDDVSTYGRDARSKVKPRNRNDDGDDVSTYGRDTRSEVKPCKYNDDGDDVSTYGRDARSEVKPPCKYNDDGDDVSTYGRDTRSKVKPRNRNDDGDDVSTYGRDARSEVKPRKYNDDGDDVSTYGRDTRSAVKSRKHKDDGGDSTYERDVRSEVNYRKHKDDGGDSNYERDVRSEVKYRKHKDDGGNSTYERDVRSEVKYHMHKDDGGDSTDEKDARSDVEQRKFMDDGGDARTYGRGVQSKVEYRKFNDDGDDAKTYGRDARSEVKHRNFKDEGDNARTYGRGVRNEVEHRKFKDDGDDAKTYGRGVRNEVEHRKFKDDGDDARTYGRGVRNEVEHRKLKDDRGDARTYERDAGHEVNPLKYNDDEGDASPMEVDTTDNEDEEKAPVSGRRREQDEETIPCHSHRSKTPSPKSNAKRDGMTENVTNNLGLMALEGNVNRTEYLNAGKGVVKVSSSVVNESTRNVARDTGKNRTDGKNRPPRKTTKKSNSKHAKNSGEDVPEKYISDMSDCSTEFKTRRDQTEMEIRKEGKGSNRSVKAIGSEKPDGFGNAHISTPDSRETTQHSTGRVESPVGSRRGSTSGGRIPEDKCEKRGKKSSRNPGRSFRRGKSESSSDNSSRGSSKASKTSRNKSRSLSNSEASSKNSRSGGSSSSSSSENGRNTSRRAQSRSSSRGPTGRSPSGSRSRRTSSSDGEEGRKRAQVSVVGAGVNGSGQWASKGHGKVQDRKETNKSKQENRSEAPKGNKNTTGRNSNSRERDISSSSKNSDKNKKSKKTKERKKMEKKSSSSDKRSGKDTSGSSNKKNSEENKKVRSRNKSIDRDRQDRSDSDEEVRDENAGRSARFSSERTPTKSRIQHKWQYKDDNGWTTYGQIPSTRNTSGAKTVTSDDIELHYLEDEQLFPLVIEINNVHYLLNFKKMTQTNQKTRAQRNIRRILKNNMDFHSAPGQTNLSGSSSENTFPAHAPSFSPYASGSNNYSASNYLTTSRPNNYDKHRSTSMSANDFSVKHVWQFEDEHGNWITYGKSNFTIDIKKATTSDDIEKVFSKDPSRAIMRIHSKSNEYILHFRTMTQINERTQVQRRVRRVPEHAAKTSPAEKVKPSAGDLVGSGKEYISFEWQFEDETGNWITYGQVNSAGMSHCTTTVTSDDIEKFYNSSPKKVVMTIKSSTNDYVLDFTSMTQTNEKTSVQRRIRRIPKIRRDNKPHETFGSGSSNSLYPNISILNSAISYPNPASSYATTTAYGGRDATHGHGGGYSGHGSGVGNMHINHSGAGGGGGGFNSNGYGAGNMHSTTGGRGSGFNDHGDHNIRPGHSSYATSFKWQFMNENGYWITYGEINATGSSYPVKTSTSSYDIERHCLMTNWQQPMRIQSPTNVYTLDFVNMLQVNMETKATKPIRRVPLYHA